MALYLRTNTETIAFLYRWTNMTTKMWYEGSRTASKCHPEDGYICSSPKVKSLILENMNNWERQILVIGSSNYIRKLEANRLQLLDAKNDPMSYNKNNADGKFTTLGITQNKKWLDKRIASLIGKKKPIGFGDKIKKARTGMKFDAVWCKNIGIASTGRTQSLKAREKNKQSNLGDKNHFYGKNHTDETKVKCGAQNKGTKSAKWNGYWIAPTGEKFITIKEAHNQYPIVALNNLRLWCKNNKNGWTFESLMGVV